MGKNIKDTKVIIASALLANEIHLIGRSFKYHRQRGIFSSGSEEPNGIVQLETKEYTEPNRRVTEIQLRRIKGFLSK